MSLAFAMTVLLSTSVFQKGNATGITQEQAAEDSVYSNASDGFLNVRSQPSPKGTIIGQLFTGGSGALYLGKKGNWYEIRFNGNTGYVNSRFASFRRTGISGDRNRMVYMVVMGSYEHLDEAKKAAEAVMQDWLPHVVYKGTSNGKTVYRMCVSCYYSRQRAEGHIKELKPMIPGMDFWVWESKGMPECVYCPKGLSDETFDSPLTPQR